MLFKVYESNRNCNFFQVEVIVPWYCNARNRQVTTTRCETRDEFGDDVDSTEWRVMQTPSRGEC